MRNWADLTKSSIPPNVLVCPIVRNGADACLCEPVRDTVSHMSDPQHIPAPLEGRTIRQPVIGPFHGSSFFCVHSLRLNKLECSTRICCDKQSLLAVPIFVGDETADGILPVDPTALSWTFRWSSHHRSNRPFKSPHNLVRPAVGNRGILPWLPNRIPTRPWSLLALSR